MAETINIYCDESCHLQGDGASVMVLGCIWCPASETRAIAERLRGVKAYHRLATDQDYTPPNRPFEVKWTKISAAKAGFYHDWVDVFFQEKALRFRGILVSDKSRLQHELFEQSHDDWYYKMVFLLVDRIVSPTDRHRIYLDIKDTRSEAKRARLEEYLRNRSRDADGQVIERVQQIRSHESELMQLADVFIGAIAYQNRVSSGDLKGAGTNAGKIDVIRHIQRLSGKSLANTTWQGERKLNLLRWEGRGGGLIP
jgi:Protein of unknown function (DUF3800)